MTGTSNVLLGIIAVSVLLMAIMQIGLLIFAARYAKKLMTITEELQRDVKPLVARINAITEEVHRATSLATAQMQKVDTMVTDLSRRVGETSASLQSFLTGPFLKGTAVVTGLRAALTALLTTRPQPAGERDEEEDALFVG